MEVKKQEGIIPPGLLETRRIMLLGAGSFGAPFGKMLSYHDVGSKGDGGWVIIDGDKVSSRNGPPYELDDVGISKPTALREQMLRVNRDIKILCLNKMVRMEDVNEIAVRCRKFHLLCLFIDDIKIVRRLSEQCKNEVPILWGAFHKECGTAEMAYSLPHNVDGGRTPPISRYINDSKIRGGHSANMLWVDTLFVVSFAAPLAMRILLETHEQVNFGGNWRRILPPFDLEAPYYILGLQNEWIFKGQGKGRLRSVLQGRVNLQHHRP